jgi:hypothetical protein
MTVEWIIFEIATFSERINFDIPTSRATERTRAKIYQLLIN